MKIKNGTRSFKLGVGVSTQVTFLSSIDSLSGLLNDHGSFIICDRVLSRFIRQLLSNQSKVYWVNSGEKLKSVESFTKHISKISQKSFGSKVEQFISIGGGSVGDFTGFIASIFKRGTNLIQIPTTWLSAIDSAHGGKTGLNIGKVKNQIGTFHSPSQIYICRDILENQNIDRKDDAFGELFKISILEGRDLWTEMLSIKEITSSTLWKMLPKAIAAKYKIVRLDPYEQKGARRALNFGHTFGHAFETNLGLSHGISVCLGMIVAMKYSVERNIMKTSELNLILQSKPGNLLLKICKDRGLFDLSKQISTKNVLKCLKMDKKAKDAKALYFIFLKKPGTYQIRVQSTDELVDFWSRFRSNYKIQIDPSVFRRIQTP